MGVFRIKSTQKRYFVLNHVLVICLHIQTLRPNALARPSWSDAANVYHSKRSSCARALYCGHFDCRPATELTAPFENVAPKPKRHKHRTYVRACNLPISQTPLFVRPLRMTERTPNLNTQITLSLPARPISLAAAIAPSPLLLITAIAVRIASSQSSRPI